MKIRSKKSGKVIHAYPVLRTCDGETEICYSSINEFNEAWEDYKPKEPLIKDEKIRKAVRMWAKANEIIKAFIVLNEHMNWSVYGDDIDRNRFSIEFFDRVVSEKNETAQYTIAELCGEEE